MANPEVSYRERLTVSWWVWPVTLGVATMLAAQLTIGAAQLRHPLTYLITCGLAALGLLALGRIRIEVIRADGKPRVGEARDEPRDNEPRGNQPRGDGPLAEGQLAGELRVDDARLPLEFVASVATVDPAQRRDLLGVDCDPLAFVIQRPWVPGGVRIELDDPNDPTPYWFVSSRRPDRLAAAIMTARGGVGREPIE